MNLKKATEALERAKAAATNMRQRANEATEKSVSSFATIGGGALGGYLQAKYPKIADSVDSGLVVGGALTLAGLFGVGGKYSDAIAHVGAGMLAFEVGNRVQDSVKQGEASVGYLTSGETSHASLPMGSRLESVLPGLRNAMVS